MADCPNITGCPMPLEEGIGATYRKHYCTKEFRSCARYRVKDALGGPAVPRWLKPNMDQEAKEILAAGRSAGNGPPNA